jgi:hypothetical protein
MLPQNTVPAAGPSTFAQKNFSTIDFCKNPNNQYNKQMLVARDPNVPINRSPKRKSQVRVCLQRNTYRMTLLRMGRPLFTSAPVPPAPTCCFSG